jgi:hypothetical protein
MLRDVISCVAILLAASLLASPPVATIAEGPRPLAWQPAPTPPGGYWSVGERSEPEPPDGHDALTIGSVVFSLGLIRAGAGGAAVYMATRPDLCAVDCRSMSLYGWAGVGFGALMFVSGIVTFSVGAAQRAKHERWQRGEAKLDRRGRLAIGPALDLRF